MEATRRRRGVSKGEWLETGLEFLCTHGVSGITVEALARSLGIAKSGFYWHFKDRQDLLRQLLAHWTHEITEVVSDNPEVLALEPHERLHRTAEMVLKYDLGRYELAIRQWALQDAAAAHAVRKVNRLRLDFVGRAFAELGFAADELELRAMLFVGYQTWEATMFPEISRKRRRKLIARRIELLSRR